MGRVVRVEKILPYKVKDVWQALTTPRIIKEWGLQTNFKLKKGEAFYFRDTSRKRELVINCKLIEFEENKKLIYIWGDRDHVPTLVEYTLTDTDGGTKLLVKHGEFKGLSGYFASKNFSGVWKKMIKFELPKAMEKFNFKKIN